MTANFTLFFAFYILTPLLPLYLSEHFGATKDIIGLVLSGYTITALLFRPFSGYVVDSFPRKTVLMIAFGAFAIFFAGYLAASTLLLFTIVRTLHGGPFGALTVANSTVAIDVLPSSRRTEGIGYYGLSNNLAMAIAPTIGIFIYQLTNSFEFLFWLAFIVACLGWLVDSTVKIEKRPCTNAPSKLSLDRFFLTRGWLLGLNMVAFGFSFGVLSYLWQRGHGHHRRHRHVLHALLGRLDTLTSARRQSPAQWACYPQRCGGNGHLISRIYHFHTVANSILTPPYSFRAPRLHRLLRLSHTHRTGKRPHVARIPEYDY